LSVGAGLYLIAIVLGPRAMRAGSPLPESAQQPQRPGRDAAVP
jgi:hypothetical protein